MTLSTRRCEYAPAALNNLFLAGNVKQGTLDTRNNAEQLLSASGGGPEGDALLARSTRRRPTAPSSTAYLSIPRAAPFAGEGSTPPRVVEPIDRSFGGLVEVTR